MLRKYLGLTLIGGLAMSLGFGIIITVFMYFDVLFWSDSVPLDEGSRVVAVQIWDPENNRRAETSVADFERWRSGLRSLEDMGAFRTVEQDIVHADGQTERVNLAEISAAGFRAARVAPVLGRPLLPEDERPGAEPVVVIGYDVWQSRFNGDPEILGRTLRFDAGVRTIVGVMPGDFGFPINHRFWVPLQVEPLAHLPAPPAGAIFARLAPGISLEAAGAELAAAGMLQTDDAGDRSEPLRPAIVPYATNFIADISPESVTKRAWTARLIIMFVSLLLIPPCVNIAMLVYARIVSRQEEIAVRTALGASRGRIVLQLFIEMLVLSTLAVCLALAVVRFILGVIEQAMARELTGLPFWISFDLSLNTLIFAAALAVLAALIIGVLPAVKATASYASPGLSALDRRHSLRLGPLFTVLIIGQVAFSFAALPSAIELAWGVLRSNLLGPGFAADQYLTAQMSLDTDAATLSAADEAANASRFREDLEALVRRLEADPRPASRVSVASAMPGEGPWRRFIIEDLGDEAVPAADPILEIGVPLVRQISIDERYFDVFGVPVLTGRGFRPGEFQSASRSILISAAFAEGAFGDANPLGRRLRYSSPTEAGAASEEPWYEIVGVVADRPSHPYRGSVFHAARPGAFYPASIGFRTGPDTASLRDDLRAVAATIDPALRLERVLTLKEIYDGQAFGNYLGGFALIAGSLSVLLLAAAGTYALMSFTVNHRRREIAIRMALGARPRGLLGTIFRRAIRQMSVGAALGLAVALLVQHFVPVDRLGGLHVPGVVPGAIAFLVAMGLIAALGPARRALSADPSEALRDSA